MKLPNNDKRTRTQLQQPSRPPSRRATHSSGQYPMAVTVSLGNGDAVMAQGAERSIPERHLREIDTKDESASLTSA